MDARVSPADPSNLAWSECILEADQQGTGIPQVRRIDARRQSLDGGRQLIEEVDQQGLLIEWYEA
ncbi:hypothetical protein, partial [Stenotrophomonas maltophilia]|uniref:hypothetical protein n=1 Tax=Stenotrophomonas maltophilia TaxID=40324 RepID=UPI0013DBE8D5